jgi:acyl carrier protein
MGVGLTTVDRVGRLIAETLSIDVPSDDTDLFDSHLIDSLALVTLIAEIEEEFGIRIELEELDLDHFRSVGRIAEFLTDTISAASTGRTQRR